MTVTVVATIFPIPEHRAEVIAAFEETIAKVHANHEGCELYALQEGEDRLVMIEKWTSPELLAAHGKAPEMLELREAVKDKLAAPLEVLTFRPHPAGTIGQGTL